MLSSYATSFYGSSLWDPYSEDCEKLYRSWNVTVRNTLDVDRTTHRYLIEPLSDGLLHPKVMLISRLVEFYRSQLESPKFCIRFLMRLTASDLRTKLGRTLCKVATELNVEVDQLDGKLVKNALQYSTSPDCEAWRIPIAVELLDLRSGRADVIGFSKEEIDDMLRCVCTS